MLGWNFMFYMFHFKTIDFFTYISNISARIPLWGLKRCSVLPIMKYYIFLFIYLIISIVFMLGVLEQRLKFL